VGDGGIERAGGGVGGRGGWRIEMGLEVTWEVSECGGMGGWVKGDVGTGRGVRGIWGGGGTGRKSV